MYIGFFTHSIDSKNRIFIPSDFRTGKKPRIISRGLEKCLYLFDAARWSRIVDKFDALSWGDKTRQRAFKRMLMAGAVACGADSHGRLLVPAHLKEYAGIKKDAAIIGMGDRIEIWDLARWKSYSAGFGEKSFGMLAEKLDI